GHRHGGHPRPRRRCDPARRRQRARSLAPMNSKGAQMKRKTTLLIAAAALCGAVLVTAAFGATSSASSPQAAKGALVALGKTPLGKVLVDARGRTLYLFDKDTR